MVDTKATNSLQKNQANKAKNERLNFIRYAMILIFVTDLVIFIHSCSHLLDGIVTSILPDLTEMTNHVLGANLKHAINPIYAFLSS